MQVIPIQAVPVQTVSTVVDGQNCQIYLNQTSYGMLFDLNVNGIDVVDAIACQDANPLVCIQYNGFQGNFFFIDTQGNEDPPAGNVGDPSSAVGLGSRWQLVYITADENALLPVKK